MRSFPDVGRVPLAGFPAAIFHVLTFYQPKKLYIGEKNVQFQVLDIYNDNRS